MMCRRVFKGKLKAEISNFSNTFFFLKLNISKVKFVESFPLVSGFLFAEKLLSKLGFSCFCGLFFASQKLNQQPTVTYDMGNREKAIDNKGPRELFKGLCPPYFSEMFIRGLNIHDKHQSLCFFIIWPCLTGTGNYPIHEFDWLKSILKTV